METKRKKIIIAILLILTISTYFNIIDAGNVRSVEFLSIFTIGALSALLVNELIGSFKK